MPPCINVIHNIAHDIKSYFMNCKKNIHSLSTFLLGNLWRVGPCYKHLPSKHGNHFMLGLPITTLQQNKNKNSASIY